MIAGFYPVAMSLGFLIEYAPLAGEPEALWARSDDAAPAAAGWMLGAGIVLALSGAVFPLVFAAARRQPGILVVLTVPVGFTLMILGVGLGHNLVLFLAGIGVFALGVGGLFAARLIGAIPVARSAWTDTGYSLTRPKTWLTPTMRHTGGPSRPADTNNTAGAAAGLPAVGSTDSESGDPCLNPSDVSTPDSSESTEFPDAPPDPPERPVVPGGLAYLVNLMSVPGMTGSVWLLGSGHPAWALTTATAALTLPRWASRRIRLRALTRRTAPQSATAPDTEERPPPGEEDNTGPGLAGQPVAYGKLSGITTTLATFGTLVIAPAVIHDLLTEQHSQNLRRGTPSELVAFWCEIIVEGESAWVGPACLVLLAWTAFCVPLFGRRPSPASTTRAWLSLGVYLLVIVVLFAAGGGYPMGDHPSSLSTPIPGHREQGSPLWGWSAFALMAAASAIMVWQLRRVQPPFKPSQITAATAASPPAPLSDAKADRTRPPARPHNAKQRQADSKTAKRGQASPHSKKRRRKEKRHRARLRGSTRRR
ncbi:MAG: hypothetical protein LBO20_09920 [Bifidobacteriaceae bacterium]|nr:hypothetical protein [Bifidobacteriaceae bacterium]